MRKKALRPRTIIPPELYVERAADRQLRSIVDDMGRPGYVLVARQMGKTNLLLNMKRERTEDIVLYVDLSSRSDTPRVWFRRIIDGLIECDPERFYQTTTQIADFRKSDALEPSTEFDRSLRLLLRTTPRRMVIVLDEIDSLVNTTYSDIILAQIRSMYFSRVNYPEYQRLTYVLSGVAEPVDLIKDKNISPFNIGEKIYLDDFSRVEFDDFLGRAGLNLSAAATERIYYWACGNPRMTWDICSEIEDLLVELPRLDESDVDKVVEKLYLTVFDRAPVDHIRTLVESDSQIRDAIVSIRYGKGDTLDDKVKSRLYLAGISRFGPKGHIEIKNSVIDAALSDRWIAQLASTRRSLLFSASESYKNQRYEDALSKFEQVRASASSADELDFPHRLELALCYLWTGRTGKAINELRPLVLQTRDPSLQQQIQHYLGAALVSAGTYQEGLDLLQISMNGPNVSFRRQSSVTAMSAYLRLGPKQYAREALQLADRVLENLSVAETASDHEVLISVLYSRAQIHVALENLQAAVADLERAQSVAPPELLPAVLLFLHSIERDEAKRSAIAIRAAETILDHKLRPTSLKVGTLFLMREHLALTIAHLQRANRLDLQEKVLDFTELTVEEGYRRFDTLVELFESLPSEELKRSGLSILLRAVRNHLGEVSAFDSRRRAFRCLAVYADDDLSVGWTRKYFQELMSSIQPDALEHEDAAALLQIGMQGLNKPNLELLEALPAVNWHYADAMREKYPLEHSLLLFFEMQFHKISGTTLAAERAARRTLEVLDDLDRSDADSSAQSVAPMLRRQAREILRPTSPKDDPFRKFGRNERLLVQYGSDPPKERKFKHVADDLRSGRCVLVPPKT